MHENFSGQRVVVTGASRGLGRGIALELAARGHTVGLVARSAAQLAGVADEIRALGGDAHTSPCDLRDWQSASPAIGSLVDAMGGIDALVNNAGRVELQAAENTTASSFEDLLRTNILTTHIATTAVLPYMLARGAGHFVNISSISGYTPLSGGAAYAATKYAVTGYSDSLFLELRDRGIKVSVVFCGSVESGGDQTSWKLWPQEVGAVIHGLLASRTQDIVSRVEIRPLRRPQR